MPTPQNKPALLRFIAMVNYLSPYLPQPKLRDSTLARVDPGRCAIFMVHGSRESPQKGEATDFIHPSISL